MDKVKIYILLSLLQGLTFTASGQYNIVPWGHFDYPQNEFTMVPSQTSFVAPPWGEVGAVSSGAPQFFSVWMDCGTFGNETCYGVPDNWMGHQIPLGGVQTNSGYVGMFCNFTRKDGIKVKLSEPLKKGYTYHLTYNAVKKSTDDVRIEYKFGKDDDDWINATCFNCNSHEDIISQDGGTNNDQWQTVDFAFTPDECGYNWLFIRTKNMASNQGAGRVLIDNISIINSCTSPCSQTYGDMSNVICNNIHTQNNPLTFSGLNNVGDIILEVFPITSNAPVRSIVVNKPAPLLSWDGRDNNGNLVANGTYRYELTLGNDCSCHSINKAFIKDDDPSVFNVTWQNQGGVLVFHSLNNVTNFDLTVKDGQNNIVRTLSIINPRDTIAWDGKNNSGSFVAFATYTWELTVSNICEKKLYTGSHSQAINIDPNDPYFALILPYLNYTPISKPFVTCPYLYNYNSFNRPPKACCSL